MNCTLAGLHELTSAIISKGMSRSVERAPILSIRLLAASIFWTPGACASTMARRPFCQNFPPTSANSPARQSTSRKAHVLKKTRRQDKIARVLLTAEGEFPAFVAHIELVGERHRQMRDKVAGLENNLSSSSGGCGTGALGRQGDDLAAFASGTEYFVAHSPALFRRIGNKRVAGDFFWHLAVGPVQQGEIVARGK